MHSHAIMIYLSDKHGWEDWCPKDLRIRARVRSHLPSLLEAQSNDSDQADLCALPTQINEYMNWHHLNTRRSSEIFFNQLMVNLGRAKPGQERMLATKDQVIADIFRILEFWLRHGNLYLVSDKKPTVVDLSCYNEVIQLEVMGLLDNIGEKFPKAAAWLQRMKVRRPHVPEMVDSIHCLILTVNRSQDLPHHDEMLAPMVKFFKKFKLASSKL